MLNKRDGEPLKYESFDMTFSKKCSGDVALLNEKFVCDICNIMYIPL